MSAIGDAYHRFDRFQQRHAWLGLPLAVRQKYGDDQGGYLAATIAYYGFFAVFPLLLVLVTVLGFVLRGHPSLRETVVHSALAQFPVVGPQLASRSLSGSGIALGLGIVGALWGGTGFAAAVENAFNHVWDVPFRRRPDFVRQRLRGLVVLLGFGIFGTLTTFLAGQGTLGLGYGLLWKVGGVALSLVLDVGLFWVGLHVLTARTIPFAWHRLGAIVAAVLWVALQAGGGWYVGHEVRHASNAYGTFALVLGLLAWIYLGAHAMVLAAEINVVWRRRLWPRSFSVIVPEPLTEADARALTAETKVQLRRDDQRVTVEFRDGG